MNLDFLTQSSNTGGPAPMVGGPTLAQQMAAMGQGLGAGNLSAVSSAAYPVTAGAMPSMIPSFDPQSINVPMVSSDSMQTAMQQGGLGTGGMGFADKASLILGGLNTLSNLWGGFETRNLAKKQFAFTKDFAETNLANSMKEYNTRLADRARARAHTEGKTQASADAYVSENKLSRSGS